MYFDTRSYKKCRPLLDIRNKIANKDAPKPVRMVMITHGRQRVPTDIAASALSRSIDFSFFQSLIQNRKRPFQSAEFRRTLKWNVGYEISRRSSARKIYGTVWNCMYFFVTSGEKFWSTDIDIFYARIAKKLKWFEDFFSKYCWPTYLI